MDAERDELARVMQALASLRIEAASTEAVLHQQALEALTAHGLTACSEVRLAPRCRIDLLCGGVGIEIKKGRPAPAPLARQLARYAACPQVQQLLVIAPRAVNLPRTIGGKRVTVMGLERLWGIGLP